MCGVYSNLFSTGFQVKSPKSVEIKRDSLNIKQIRLEIQVFSNSRGLPVDQSVQINSWRLLGVCGAYSNLFSTGFQVKSPKSVEIKRDSLNIKGNLTRNSSFF